MAQIQPRSLFPPRRPSPLRILFLPRLYWFPGLRRRVWGFFSKGANVAKLEAEARLPPTLAHSTTLAHPANICYVCHLNPPAAGTSHGGGRRGYIPCGTGDCAGGATQAHVPANDSDLSDASAFKVPALPARLSGRSGSGGSGSSSPEPCWPSCAAGSGQGSPIRSACSDASDATSTAGAASPTETVSVMAADVQPQSPFAALLPAPAPVSQLVRRHAPPKRRPTPQVLPGAPAGVSSAAADSAAHGDAVCDEQLLSSWCPVSAKRARMTGSPPLPEQQQRGVLAGGCSSDSISSGVTAVLLPQHPPRQQHQQQQQQEGLSSPSCSSSSSTAAESAAQALQQLLHCGSGPLSGPAPDVLLFGDCTGQQPLRSWTGAIKHRGGGRAAELCHVTLQVRVQRMSCHVRRICVTCATN